MYHCSLEGPSDQHKWAAARGAVSRMRCLFIASHCVARWENERGQLHYTLLYFPDAGSAVLTASLPFMICNLCLLNKVPMLLGVKNEC